MEADKNGNLFVEIGNIRMTYVDKKNRQTSKNWSGSDTIRFSAYRNATTNSLHKGAEVPIKSKDEIIELIEALCVLYKVKTKTKNIK